MRDEIPWLRILKDPEDRPYKRGLVISAKNRVKIEEVNAERPFKEFLKKLEEILEKSGKKSYLKPSDEWGRHISLIELIYRVVNEGHWNINEEEETATFEDQIHEVVKRYGATIVEPNSHQNSKPKQKKKGKVKK